MSHASLLVAIDKATDIESAVAFQMEPFNEDAHWFEDGTRWDWYQIGGRWDGYMIKGNVIQVKDVHPNKFKERRLKEAKKHWKEFCGYDPDARKLFFHEDPEVSEEEFIRKRTQGWFPPHYAFLADRHWHERGRMGFFGVEHPTECELKAEDESKIHRCKARAKGAPDAYIVSWKDERESWDFKFYDRFIKPLDPEKLLVTVDYHI